VPHVVAVSENLFFNVTGTITANVWVTGNNKLRQVSMKLVSDTGDVNAKVVRLHCPEFLLKIR
jgi:hypothetical protein